MEQSSPGGWNEVIDPALVIRYTRHWLHYGAIGFVVVCTLIGALKGLAGG